VKDPLEMPLGPTCNSHLFWALNSSLHTLALCLIVDYQGTGC
jgi:hypothetical protein